MDTLTVLKVIALSLLTVAAVFVMLAAATMWRAERTASKRVNGLISTDPVEPNGGVNYTTTAMQDIAEITNLDGKEKQTPPQEGNDAQASDKEPSTDSDENPPAPSASDQEPAQRTNRDSEGTGNSSLEQRVTHIEQALEAIEKCIEVIEARHEDNATGVAVPVTSVPKYITQAWSEDIENLQQAITQHQRREGVEKKEPHHNEYAEDGMLTALRTRYQEVVAERDEEESRHPFPYTERAATLDSLAKFLDSAIRGMNEKTKPQSEATDYSTRHLDRLHVEEPRLPEYPLFEDKPSSREWKRHGGLSLDRRMDALRDSDNCSVCIVRLQVDQVRKMDSIPSRIMEGVRKAVAEAEKFAEKEI